MSAGLENKKNLKWFALSSPPPGVIELAGLSYRLVRVFKHDFFAATCLYESAQAQAASQEATPGAQDVPTLPSIPTLPAFPRHE